jgi:hypothetical protein
MDHYAGIDVSLECATVSVVDASGKIVRESEVASEPEALIAWFGSLGFGLARIGLEAGPLSQWLYAAMRDGGLAVELLETRHVRSAFKAMPVKTDRNDARGIAQLMRLGWFRPVHCKSIAAQEMRALLTARKLIQAKLFDVEMSLRGILRGFGLKVGPTTPRRFAGRIRQLVAGQATLETVAAAMLAAHEGYAARVQRVREAVADDGTDGCSGQAADVGAGRRHDRRPDLYVRDRRSGTLQIVEGGRCPFRVDAEEVSIRGDRCYRPDQQDWRRFRAYGTLRGCPRHAGPGSQGLGSQELGDEARPARRDEEGQGRACAQARCDPAPDVGRRNQLRAHCVEQAGRRGGLTEETRDSGGHDTNRPEARSRRRDDGRGQAVRFAVALRPRE